MKRLVAIGIALSALLLGQTNRGGITGTITDQSSAVIAGAVVSVINVGTNDVRTATTSNSGSYSVQNLEPVTYRIEVDAPGFKKAIINEVKVDTATMATANLRLETGSVKSEVTVSASAPLINTESGTAGQNIGRDLIDNSPLVNRSVLDLALSVPGVVGDVGSEDPGIGAGAAVPGYNLSVNGGRAGSTQILADGVNNTGVGVARAVVSFSPETVQEFTVQTNAYSAEYGRTGGGLINITTRSGTNAYHGTALWYQRNPALNAAPFTTAAANRPISNTRDNQFSLAAGGPVIIPKLYNGRNKTFFFGAIEPRYRTDHLQVDGAMPDDAMRGGDFSNTVRVPNGDSVPVPISVANRFPGVVQTDATLYQQFVVAGNQLQAVGTPAAGQTYAPFPGNILPKSMLDPVSQKLLQWVPKPNTPWFLDPSGNLANWIGQRHLKTDDTRYTLRVDRALGANNRLSVRATIIPVVGITDYGNAVNGNGGNYSYSRQLMLDDSHIISPRVFNDLRMNYTRGRFSGTFGTQFDAKTGENLSTENGLPSLTHGGVPNMAIGLGTYGGIGAGGSTLGDDVEERYSAGDTITLTRGSMTIKAGVEVTHELLNTVNYFAAAGGIYTFRNYQTDTNGASSGTGGIQFASFLLGVPNQVNMSNALLPYYYRWNSGSAFVQDDWKVRQNLTLNIGLRYALQLPRTEKFNHQGTFAPSLAQPYPLASPLQLADGNTVSSVLVPPFALDGYGGRSRYLWPADYTDFEPRFGFAYSPGLLRWNQRAIVIRGGYGLSHSPLNGQNRQPLPSFTAAASGSGPVNPSFAQRLSSNPPAVTPQSWSQVLNVPENGLVTLNSINYSGQGFAVSPDMRTPYSQNWNATLSFQLGERDAIEVAYVGNKGTHLMLPKTNNNASSVSLVNALQANNQNPATLVPDPLGRIGTNGRVVTVQQGSLGSTYLGFTNLYTWWNSAGNSIYNAAYISYLRRASHGLTVSTSYTFGKSIDDASDSSPEANVLTTSTSIAGGSANFGGSRRLDRSVSTFDVKHNFVLTSLYDLPIGRGRALFTSMPRVLNMALGAWTVSSIYRVRSGAPFAPVLRDNNLLGDNSSGSEYSIRPNIVAGVPLLNPLYSSTCPITTTCQPYLNPAAFSRPAFGQFGNSPRTLDWARGPSQQYFDASIQKNFQVSERVRVQFRVDLLNAFNHPIFGPPAGYGGGNSWNANGAPSTAPISTAAYDTWAKFNNQPLSNTTAGAANLAAVQAFVTGNRNAQGALPANFFAISLPQGSALANANSYNILTLNGYKQYTLASANGTGFGDLGIKSASRYVQFGLKIYF